MTRTVYLNGEYLPEHEAKVSIFDRAFLMADGVYEVTSVLGGKLIDFDGHMARLERSLTELDMPARRHDDLLAIHRELVRAQRIEEGLVYLQVTRGRRGSRFRLSRPGDDRADNGAVHPVQAGPGRQPGRRKGPGSGHLDRGRALGPARHQDGAAALSVDGQDDGQEGRGRRRLDGRGRQGDRGHVEQRLYRQGQPDRHPRAFQRHPARDHPRRGAALAREAQMEVEERPFTIEEAKAADEAFVTSASAFVMPVVRDRRCRAGRRHAGREGHAPARDLYRRKPEGRDLSRGPVRSPAPGGRPAALRREVRRRGRHSCLPQQNSG